MRVSKRVEIKKIGQSLFMLRPELKLKAKLDKKLIAFYKANKDYKELRKTLTKSGLVQAMKYDSKSKKSGVSSNTGYQTIHNSLIEFVSKPELTYNAVATKRKIDAVKNKKTTKSKTTKSKTTKSKTTKSKTIKKVVKKSKAKKLIKVKA